MSGWKSWSRVVPVQLAPLFFLLFGTFVFNCTPTPVMAATSAAIVFDADGGEDGDPITPSFVNVPCRAEADDLDPSVLGRRDVYLDHRRFRGACGASLPQMEDLGYPRGFEARGPPHA